MKENSLHIHVYLLLLLVIITSCRSQANSAASEFVTLPAPRVDSILEFSSMITVIFEDSKGYFWIGSHGDGLCRYNPSADKPGGMPFTYFTVEQGLPSHREHEDTRRTVPMGNLIRDIQEDQFGNIIIKNADGFCKFNPSDTLKAEGQYFTPITLEKESSLITERFDFSGTDSAENWNREMNLLWFGDSDLNGAYRYDGQKLIHLTFPTQIEFGNNSRSSYATYSLHKGRGENIWFGTEGAGIMKYDEKSFICINENEEKGIIRSIFQDKSGRIWISNVLRGLQYFENDSLKNFTKEQGFYTMSEIREDDALDKSKMLDGVQTIAQADDGTLWFGTYSDGLWYYNPSENSSSLIHYSTSTGFPSNTVKTIYKDKSDKLWFGIGKEKAHLYHFDGVSFERFRKR